MGILDDANYEETQLNLEPGDKVVLYTDGIVEAMNAQEEMFGFERLLELVKNSQTQTAAITAGRDQKRCERICRQRPSA